MNIHDYRKENFGMNDFMHNLKGLVAQVGYDVNSMTSSDFNPNDCTSFVKLQEFLGIDDDWFNNHSFDPYSGIWSKNKKKD